MAEIYKGRCPEEKSAELLRMLDSVFFGIDKPEENRGFVSLLPKLYKEKYRPAYNNFIVAVDGDIKAAVGLFPYEISVYGKKLKVGGIGNVGVSEDARGKGYMIDCMNQSLSCMINDGTDYSLLGGQRQRYGFFGYELSGREMFFKVNRGNMYRVFGKEYESPFKAVRLSPDDRKALKKIASLYEKSGVYAIRPEDDLYDILCSWDGIPYAVYEGEEIRGYFVTDDGNGIHEFAVEKTEYIAGLIDCILRLFDRFDTSFTVPLFRADECEFFVKICDRCEICHSENLNILRYKNFLDAFLSSKAKRTALADGSLSVLVHGYRCDELLKITVDNNEVCVEETDENPDIELEHLEAIRFFTGLWNEKRDKTPLFAQSWFPLDFFSYSQDNV